MATHCRWWVKGTSDTVPKCPLLSVNYPQSCFLRLNGEMAPVCSGIWKIHYTELPWILKGSGYTVQDIIRKIKSENCATNQNSHKTVRELTDRSSDFNAIGELHWKSHLKGTFC